MGDQGNDGTTREGLATLRGRDRDDLATPPTGLSRVALGVRYELGAVIARGGMGEVVAATDRQIGREVAVKRMRERERDPSDRAMARFFREAMIQGRLDHPAIVPVHELGVDADGRPFFVMKKLAGTTLGELITRSHPREALLRAFADVCLAVEFAHQRGIVHRDLKPSNIVLGEYGEAYVLDWGIARVVGAVDEPDLARGEPDLDTGTDGMIGTYGYMAPEQARASAQIDGRTDVYALGCILFEILSGEPLHARGMASLTTTLNGVDARPSTRGADVPPELEALCVEATVVACEHRIPSARQLGERLQRFLDGDRDVAQRRELAAAHLATASQAFTLREDAESRRVAMREAGRALALDPSLPGPGELVTRLMLEPPRALPPEVAREIELDNARTVTRSLRIGAWAYLGFLALVPSVFNGSGLVYVGLLVAIIAANITILLRMSPGTARVVAFAFASAALVGVVARIFSPFFIAPAIAAVITMAIVFTPSYEDVRSVAGLALLMAVAIIAPWAVEAMGLVSTTTVFAPGSITFMAPANRFASPLAAATGMVLYVLALVTASAFVAHAMRRTERAMRHHMRLQAWQLRQLVG